MAKYIFSFISIQIQSNIFLDEKTSDTVSISNDWGTSTFIAKPFKKRSPSPPVVAMPSKKAKGGQTYSSQKPKGQQSSGKSLNAAPVRGSRRSLSSVSSISSDELSDGDSKRNKESFGRMQRIRRSPVPRGRPLYNR